MHADVLQFSGEGALLDLVPGIAEDVEQFRVQLVVLGGRAAFRGGRLFLRELRICFGTYLSEEVVLRAWCLFWGVRSGLGFLRV